MEERVRAVQAAICDALEERDESRFREDRWEGTEGGGGWSRVLQDGSLFEKAGVNVASVEGELSPEASEVMLGKKGIERGRHAFAAVGLSVVLHPVNPHAPTIHCNYRYFELADGRWWFGGGTDLTPIFLYEDDARHFHGVLARTCDAHDERFYPRFKRWCDEYFHLPHRGETRGVGGIFFDDLRDRPAEDCFAFVSDCAGAFLEGYLPILDRRFDVPFGSEAVRWQRLRRGRYVEFNLMYDRGTLFGLRTGGRVESILMSLPLHARWEYDHEPEPGSREAETLDVLRNPREWVGEGGEKAESVVS